MITLSSIILLISSLFLELIDKIKKRRAYLYSKYVLWNPDSVFLSQEDKLLINPKEKTKDQAKLWMKIGKEEKKKFRKHLQDIERLKKGRFF